MKEKTTMTITPSLTLTKALQAHMDANGIQHEGGYFLVHWSEGGYPGVPYKQGYSNGIAPVHQWHVVQEDDALYICHKMASKPSYSVVSDAIPASEGFDGVLKAFDPKAKPCWKRGKKKFVPAGDGTNALRAFTPGR
jgi:hypothetical protein